MVRRHPNGECVRHPQNTWGLPAHRAASPQGDVVSRQVCRGVHYGPWTSWLSVRGVSKALWKAASTSSL